jgi:adenine deaminase
MVIKSNLIDIVARETFAAELIIENNKIISIKKIDELCGTYILPGFVDAHVHVESRNYFRPT